RRHAKLKVELKELQDELDSARKEADTTKTKLGRTAQDLANSRAKGDGLQGAFDTLKGRFEELVAQYRKTAELLRDVEAEKSNLAALATDYSDRVELCERNNGALYDATLELIDSYEHKGFMAVLGQREPVTRLKRVEIENRMDEYRRVAEDMRLKYESNTNGDTLGRTEEANPQERDIAQP
ncbi:MAG: hypothetical protein HC809_12530, partial [Gammaproteobacteria bacterium]|nr:hypothetical protein [Gammaproteobacteria bacterium]